MVRRFEGIPVTVEANLLAARSEGLESTNCHRLDVRYRDWHLYLADSARATLSSAIVAETTPRVRATHPEWSLDELLAISEHSGRIRVTGWLMLDQQHPEEVGELRGTLWEVHPITRIEVWRHGHWVKLGD